jgi:hypothetical protein
VTVIAEPHDPRVGRAAQIMGWRDGSYLLEPCAVIRTEYHEDYALAYRAASVFAAWTAPGAGPR